MGKALRKADIVLLIVLLALGFFVTALSLREGSGDTVLVRVDGKEYGTYSLSEDQVVAIRKDGDCVNQFIIKEGKVQMIEATCKNHYCIKQGSIEDSSRTIVCLPNRVTIEIIGG